MELHFIFLSLCWLSIQAAYVSRMTPAPRMRTPVAFRPGVSYRPWMNQRIMAAATRRAPYVLYRSPMQRFTKPYPSNNQFVRHVYKAEGPWKTTSRMPFSPATPEYDFKASASSPSRSQSDGGAIRTIPAPNLSLSEKPIIVLDGKQNLVTPLSVTSEATNLRPNYEVTEKFVDPYQFREKGLQATPVGFSKPGLPQADLSTLMRNNLALQLASEYGLSAVALPPAGPGLPQEIQIHNLQNIQIPNTQDISHPGFDSIFIPPSAIYQPDQAFLQKLQHQLLERFPSVEFIPYQTQNLPRPQSLVNFQIASPVANPSYTTSPSVQSTISPLQNFVTHQPQLSVLPVNNEQHKNVVRETQETVVTLLPQIAPENVTENQVEIITASQARNLTVPIPVLIDVTPTLSTTTVKYTDASTETTSPIYYAQIGQTVGSIVANGFFSALNEVRAAAALTQENLNNITTEVKTENATTTTSSTTTMDPDLQNYFVKSIEKDENNQTVAEVKPLLGVPFAKPEPIKVEYSVIRTEDKSQKVNKDGTVYAGQIVQSSISEDHEYNQLKADLHSRRPPLRLVDKEIKTTTPPSKLTVVKARIPPKSKLTFDEKTGEPILRIYASYVDSPLHKDMIASKIANIKHVREFSSRNQDLKSESYKGSPKSLSKLSTGAGNNKVAEFGLKLRSRIDDIVPIFDEYEE